MTTRVLHEDERYRVTLFRGSGDGSRLAVSFEHGHNQMHGRFTPAHYPNYAARMGIDALSVQTAWRDWYVSDRSAALAETLERATCGYADVLCTGFSMGGYAALRYSAACHAKRVMVVSPQYSIDPEVAPFDTKRHKKFARLGHPMPRPEAHGDTTVTGLLLYDPVIGADRAHKDLIVRAFPRLTPLALPHGGHPATGVIAAAGAIGRMVEMVAADHIDPPAIRRLHRQHRSRSDNYRLSLASAALARHPGRALPELRRLAREATPDQRFEAGLLLLEHDHPEAEALLVTLLDEVPDAPRIWGRLLSRALRRS